MDDNAKFLSEQYDLVIKTRKNKRRGRDSIAYECNIVSLTVKGMRARLDKSLRIVENYAFLVSLPKWREIMATCFEGRKIDHEICEVVIPLSEKILSPYTFNNRKNMGASAAINQLIDHIYEVSNGYTTPCRIIKLDFRGYFPNALWDYAEKVICDVIDTSKESDEYKSYLKWLTMISIQCNPANHCDLRSPRHLWKEHIDVDKSLLYKDQGVGAAIGRLIWQTAMGLYINDVILWLTDFYLIKLVVYVDDIVMVVPEEKHELVLSLIPEIRKRLNGRHVILNERKFYDQPFQHGVEFLGTHIKPNRTHLNNSIFYRAKKKIEEMNGYKYKDIDKMVQIFNSYGGLLKNRTDYGRLIELKNFISDEWWQWLEFDERRLCLSYKNGWSPNERLNAKYKLNLKKYDKNRTNNAHKRARKRHH